jgi:hypothetical protein
LNLVIPTSFLPPVSYISKLLHADHAVIDIHETFPKQTFRNRYEIATSQGRFRLTVQLSGRSNTSKTSEILVDQSDQWRVNHWRSIVTAYGSSPYFPYYSDEIKSFLFNKSERLIDFNLNALNGILKILKVKKEITFSDSYMSSGNVNFEKNAFAHVTDFHRYMQVFEEKTGFQSDLSIIDLIFNIGNQSRAYLQQLP